LKKLSTKTKKSIKFAIRKGLLQKFCGKQTLFLIA